MKAKDFSKFVLDNAKKDYGICPPPIKAQDGLNILIDHFLGEDWYVTLPIGVEQVNTEAIYAILKKYPGKRKPRNLKRIIIKFLLKMLGSESK